MRRKLLISGFLVIIIFGGVGCQKGGHLKVNPEFSINLATPHKKWGEKSEKTPVQEAVYLERGEPDFIRFWWDRAGAIKTYLEVDRQIMKKEHLEIKQSWIYLNDDEEVLFLNNTNYEVKPLNDAIRLICLYGDPDSRVDCEDHDEESKMEKWQYYSQGKIFTLLDGKIIKEQTVPRMGRKIKT